MTIRQTNRLNYIEEGGNELTSFCYLISCDPISWSLKATQYFGALAKYRPRSFRFYINGVHISLDYLSVDTTLESLVKNSKANINSNNFVSAIGNAEPYAIFLWLEQQYPNEPIFKHPDSLSRLYLDISVES